MLKKHEHIYTECVSHDEESGITVARCPCGSITAFSKRGNTVSAWSAHGAGAVNVVADDERLADDHGWTRGEAMTHQLIEKVAQAICESKPDRAGFWKTTPEARRKGYRTQARAAVVAVLKEALSD